MGSQLKICVIDPTNPIADPISKFIPPSAPIPKPPATAPAREAPSPTIEPKTFGKNEASPPTPLTSLGISPVLIAAKARPAPAINAGFTPKTVAKDEKPSRIPLGLPLSFIKSIALAISVELLLPERSINLDNPVE